MTTQETIDQAAEAMHADQCPEDGSYDDPCSCDTAHYDRLAQALSDAGLLADCHQTQRAVKAEQAPDLLGALNESLMRAKIRMLQRDLDAVRKAEKHHMKAAQTAWRAADQMRAERDALAATVQRVRDALEAADAIRWLDDLEVGAALMVTDRIRAALDQEDS